jgi:hypothetical protein
MTCTVSDGELVKKALSRSNGRGHHRQQARRIFENRIAISAPSESPSAPCSGGETEGMKDEL